MAGENALDFSHDTGDTSLLDMLGQSLGQVQQQSAQAAAADDQAAQAGVPAPPEQVGPQMGPPAPPVVGGGPAIAPTNNTIPEAAPGPGAQLQGPATQPGPAQNAQSPARLRPEPQAQEVQTDAQRGEQEMRSAEQLSEQAKAEKAQADMDFAKEAQPVMDYEARIAKDKVDATQAVQNWLTVQQNQIAANTQSDLQRAEAMAAEKPQDWWGNHSTLQKIASVAGMIGAGFSGKSAAGFMENLVNKDIADYNRRSSALATIRGIHGTQERQFQNAYHNSSTMIDTMAIARYQQAEKVLQAKRNQSQSKMVQANYDGAIAELRTEIADKIDKLNNTKLKNLAQQQQFALQWAQLAQRRQEEQTRVGKGQVDNSVYYDDLEQTIPGGPQGVDPRVNNVVKKKWSIYSNGIENGDKILQGFEQVDNGEMSLADAKVTLAPYISSMFSISRDLAGAGAKLEGPEEALVKDMSVGWKDFLEHKITGVQMAEKVRAVQSMLAQRAARVATENTKGLRPKAESAVGRVLARDKQDEETSTLERAVLQQALANNKTPEAKKLVLERLSKGGNKAAKKMLGAKSKSHWYNPEHWLGNSE